MITSTEAIFSGHISLTLIERVLLVSDQSIEIHGGMTHIVSPQFPKFFLERFGWAGCKKMFGKSISFCSASFVARRIRNRSSEPPV